MKFHKVAHRMFLLSMFAVCSLAVVLFARQRADAALSATSPVVGNGFASVGYVENTAAPVAAPTSAAPPASAPKPTLKSTASAKKTTSINMAVAVTAPPAKTTAPAVAPGIVITNTTEVPPVAADQAVAADSSGPSQPAPVSDAPGEPIIIKAADLPKEKNPKLSGVVDPTLSVKTVELTADADGQKSLNFTGDAQPNATILVYVFSSDPVVITLKADENGSWSYALDKDLADGQHEAFVAVASANGDIVSKSEPLAFVKTAQAATTIPVSQLTENQSPMERSSSQYVLFAIISMAVCLMIALVSIGILTHKRNIDETII